MNHGKLFLFLMGANANANCLYRLHHVTPLTSHLHFKHLHPSEHAVHFQILLLASISDSLLYRFIPPSIIALSLYRLLLLLPAHLLTSPSSVPLYCSEKEPSFVRVDQFLFLTLCQMSTNSLHPYAIIFFFIKHLTFFKTFIHLHHLTIHLQV